MESITFFVEDNGRRIGLEAPTDMNLSLMEVLKANEFAVQALCGGMALCATCHVQVLEGLQNLPPLGDAEADMLDTLPQAGADSRLSCQLRASADLDGLVLRLVGNE